MQSVYYLRRTVNHGAHLVWPPLIPMCPSADSAVTVPSVGMHPMADATPLTTYEF